MKGEKNNTAKVLKGVLFVAALFNLIIGGAGLFFTNLAVVVSKYAFNFNMVLTDQIGWILKPFSAYMFILGLMLMLAVQDPKSNKAVVYGFIAFTFLRTIQKTYFVILGGSSFMVNHNMGMSILNIGVLLIFGITTLVLYKKAYK